MRDCDSNSPEYSLVQLPSRSQSPSGSSFETRALQYYQSKVASILGGPVDSEFWTISVLQLSETEPPVKQALIAVSSLFEMQAENDFMSHVKSQERTTEMYAKALAATAQRVAEPNAEVVALATCVLFLCLHCLHGDRDQAVKLVRSGSRVMQKILRGLQSPNAFKSNPTTAMFLPIFERMLVLIRMFGEYMPHLRDSTLFLSGDFETRFSHPQTIDEARGTLHWLVAETHDLLISGRPHRYALDLNQNHLQFCLQRQALLRAAFMAWLKGLNRLCANNVPERRQLAQMKLTHTVADIWLATALDPDESVHDKYNEDFEAALLEAEIVVEDGAPQFTFEVAVIPPLYFIALRSRNPKTRQKALSVLQKAPAREGLWNREEALRVATRVADLETSGSQVLADGVIFKNARICDARTRYTNEEGTHVTFYSKLEGQTEIWKLWEEVIPLWYSPSPKLLEQPLYTLFTQKGDY